MKSWKATDNVLIRNSWQVQTMFLRGPALHPGKAANTIPRSGEVLELADTCDLGSRSPKPYPSPHSFDYRFVLGKSRAHLERECLRPVLGYYLVAGSGSLRHGNRRLDV